MNRCAINDCIDSFHHIPCSTRALCTSRVSITDLSSIVLSFRFFYLASVPPTWKFLHLHRIFSYSWRFFRSLVILYLNLSTSHLLDIFSTTCTPLYSHPSSVCFFFSYTVLFFSSFLCALLFIISKDTSSTMTLAS